MAEIKTPTPHIAAKRGEIAETILLPGDPLRAKYIADHFLEDAVQFNATRNMFGFTGIYRGKPASVMGTGMGCPSIGIYSYELIHAYGCKNLIRVGTAGAMQPHVKIRDMVFGMGACTDSRYVRQFRLPGDYSCICSFGLLEKAVAAARAAMGVLAVEMEAAALYSNAAAAGVNALCILTVSDSLVTGESTTAEERQTTFTNMMEVALELV